jgi:Tol biopolymer transport system component
VDKPSGIFLITVATGEKRRLTQPASPKIVEGALSFAPDGRSLAFSRSTGGYQGSIYRLDLNAALEPIGPALRLVKENMWSICPAWTANGREIIFASGTFGSLHLFRVDASGGDPTSLATTGDWSTSPAIHARKKRMA